MIFYTWTSDSVFIGFASQWFVVCLLHIRGKLIYCAPSANRMRTTQRNRGAHFCTGLLRVIKHGFVVRLSRATKLYHLYHICRWILIEGLRTISTGDSFRQLLQETFIGEFCKCILQTISAKDFCRQVLHHLAF